MSLSNGLREPPARGHRSRQYHYDSNSLILLSRPTAASRLESLHANPAAARFRTTKTVTGRATLEPARIHKLAHNDWLETGVAHQSRSNHQSLAIVAGNRNGKLWLRAVGLAYEDRIGKRIERAHQVCAGQIFLRCDTNTFALHLVGDNSVARWYGIAGVEYDLALKRAAVISTELRQRAIRNGEKERIAEGDCL